MLLINAKAMLILSNAKAKSRTSLDVLMDKVLPKPESKMILYIKSYANQTKAEVFDIFCRNNQNIKVDYQHFSSVYERVKRNTTESESNGKCVKNLVPNSLTANEEIQTPNSKPVVIELKRPKVRQALTLHEENMSKNHQTKTNSNAVKEYETDQEQETLIRNSLEHSSTTLKPTLQLPEVSKSHEIKSLQGSPKVRQAITLHEEKMLKNHLASFNTQWSTGVEDHKTADNESHLTEFDAKTRVFEISGETQLTNENQVSPEVQVQEIEEIQAKESQNQNFIPCKSDTEPNDKTKKEQSIGGWIQGVGGVEWRKYTEHLDSGTRKRKQVVEAQTNDNGILLPDLKENGCINSKTYSDPAKAEPANRTEKDNPIDGWMQGVGGVDWRKYTEHLKSDSQKRKQMVGAGNTVEETLLPDFEENGCSNPKNCPFKCTSEFR